MSWLDGLDFERCTEGVRAPAVGQRGHFVKASSSPVVARALGNLTYLSPLVFGAESTAFYRDRRTVAVESPAGATVASGGTHQVMLDLELHTLYEITVRGITENAGAVHAFRKTRCVVLCRGDGSSGVRSSEDQVVSGAVSVDMFVGTIGETLVVNLSNGSGSTRGCLVRIGIDAMHPMPAT